MSGRKAHLLAPEPWMARARCIGIDTGLFFPESGGTVAIAKAVCAECPVRSECLDYAIARSERTGIWGGKTAKERRRIRRQRRREEAA